MFNKDSIIHPNIHLVAPYKVEQTTASTIEECFEYINSKDIIAVDTETTGLDPYTSNVVMLQLGDLGRQYVIDTRHIDISILRPLLEDSKRIKILVNAIFDYKMMYKNLGIQMTRNVRDCMLQEQLLLGGVAKGTASLEALANKYTNYKYQEKQLYLFDPPLSKGIGKEFLTHGDAPFTFKQIKYGAFDVILPILINEKQQIALKKDKINPEVENEFVLGLGDVELNGFYLDREKWLKIYEDKLVEFFEKKSKLDSYLTKKNIDLINWNSPKQVTKVFKKLKIPTTVTKKIATLNGYKWEESESVRADAIERLTKDYPFVAEYLEYKELQKATSSYGKKFLENIHPVTGRVHSKFTQILNTGRISSSGPNLQNIKRGSLYRQCFGSQSEVTSMVVCDYASQEVRIMADLSGDKKLLRFFDEGDGDFHSFMARKIFNVPVDSHLPSEYRTTTKTLDFAIPYGGSAFKVSIILGIPLKEAEALIKSWYDVCPDLLKFFAKVKRFTKKHGYIVTDRVVRRRFYCKQFPEYKKFRDEIDRLEKKGFRRDEIPKLYWSKFFRTKGSIERISQNYPIQGTGASMTKWATVLFRRWIIENDYQDKIKIVNLIHDELVLEVLNELAPVAAKNLKRCMEESGKKFCPNVSWIADPAISKMWAKP
jgi:DNA polymerase-1